MPAGQRQQPLLEFLLLGGAGFRQFQNDAHARYIYIYECVCTPLCMCMNIYIYTHTRAECQFLAFV